MRAPSGARVATRRALVPGRDEYRDPFRDRLLKRRAEGARSRTPVFGFAFAIADAHDAGGLPALIRFCMAMKPPNVVLRAGAGRHLDGGVGRGRAGPFRVENRFAVVARRPDRGLAIVGADGGRMDRGQRPGSVLTSPNVERNVVQSRAV